MSPGQPLSVAEAPDTPCSGRFGYSFAMRLDFTKMHGVGNDFLVFDAPAGQPVLSAEQLRRLADRHTGIGFDQALVLEPSRRSGSSQTVLRDSVESSLRSWLITTSAARLPLSARSSHSMVVRSRWLVGSSRRRISGDGARTRASDARRASPPDSWPAPKAVSRHGN